MQNSILVSGIYLCGLLVSLFLPPVSQAQNTSATAPLAQEQQGRSAPTIRTTTRIIYVDIVVRDSAGRLVHGLPASAFHVQEDGRPQSVATFSEHTSATTHQTFERVTSGTPAKYANVAPGAQDTSLNMVLFDLVDTSPQDQQFARKRMIAFLKALPPHRQVALFVLGTRLRMIQGFTTDSAALIRAAEALEPEQLNRLRTPDQQTWDVDYASYLSREAGGGGRPDPAPTAGAMLLQNSLLEDSNNMKERLGVANRAFRELARAVNGYPGRKNLFWLAGQFPSSTYYELETMSEAAAPANATPAGGRMQVEAQQQQFAGSTAAAGIDLQAFNDGARRSISDSQIAVYPISVVGIQTDTIGPQSMGNATTGDAGSLNTAQLYFNERQTGRGVMQNIAAATGGEAFYGNNDPKGMLSRAFEDGDNYYTLAYQPTNHAFNGKYRTIRITLDHSGNQLSYRHGYYALAEQPVVHVLQSFAESMRIEAPPATMLVMRSSGPSSGSDGITMVPVELDPQAIAFDLDQATHMRSAKLQVMLIAYREAQGTQPVQSNQALNIRLEAADYTMAQERGIPLQLPLRLKTGRYAIRIGIVDLGSGRVGTLTVPYVTPEEHIPTTQLQGR